MYYELLTWYLGNKYIICMILFFIEVLAVNGKELGPMGFHFQHVIVIYYIKHKLFRNFLVHYNVSHSLINFPALHILHVFTSLFFSI